MGRDEKQLRILILEDVLYDVELLLLELKKSGLAFNHKHVWTESDFRKELVDFKPDAILSDFSLPNFTGLDALAIVKEMNLRTPFLLITGAQGEETAVDCFKAGVDDYILKSSLFRVPSALRYILKARSAEQEAQTQATAFDRVQQQYRLLLQSTGEGIYGVDLQGRCTLMNHAAAQLLGYQSEEVVDKKMHELIHHSHPNGEKYLAQDCPILASTQTGVSCRVDDEVFWRKDGNSLPVEYSCYPMIESGGVIGSVVVFSDISQRKAAAESLRASEQRYRLLFESNPLPMWVFDVDTLQILAVNDAAVAQYGYSREEFQLLTIKDLRPLGDVEKLLDHVSRLTSTLSAGGSWLHRKKDGTVIEVEIVSHDLVWQERRARLVAANDVTEKKRAQDKVLSAEEKYRSIFENALEGIFQSTPEGALLSVNPSFARIFGYNSAKEMIQQVSDIRTQLFRNPGGGQELIRVLQEKGIVKALELEAYRQDGEKIWLETNIRAVHDSTGKIAHFEGTTVDITDRKKAGEELIEAANRIHDLYNNAPCGYHSLDSNGRYLLINDTELKWLGYKREELLAKEFSDLLTRLCVKAFQHDFSLLTEKGIVHDSEYEIIRKDGSILPVILSSSAVRDTKGNFVMTRTTVLDITERKRSEGEKDSLQKQLLQAQKLEAIGQLAGGVAHDFNNTLMAIGGFSELLMLKLPPNDALRKIVFEIQKGANQGADLTKQLLAFSRQQVLSPKVLDLNQSLLGMASMLQRLIGEDVALEILPNKDTGFVMADPGQIHQVVMNLCVNARDAMPKGGKLTIQTSNVDLDEEYARTHLDVAPGRYVLLAVSDSGHGMEPEVASHIFEPFFTTKEEGKGTGLGLATVYGIVKQSGAHISVYSQAGHGTTFKIYFPRIDAAAKSSSTPQPLFDFNGKGETILLVDDNDSIRAAVSALLEIKGYRILPAGSGKKALEVARSEPGEIHLVITDVVMPEMSGREMIHLLAELRPGVKVLYMSGYTQEAIHRHGVLDEGAGFLSKPATTETILRKIRELLG